MANATDVSAAHVHGTDPQYLIEKITRAKIYDAPYWKERCFGASAATLGQTHAERLCMCLCLSGPRTESSAAQLIHISLFLSATLPSSS